MSNRSAALDVEAVCPRCGREFVAPVWIVVDVLARRDLFRRARFGSLHALRCPHCFAGEVQATRTLVLFREDATLKVITVIPEDMPPGEIADVADEAVAVLVEKMGSEWNEGWMHSAAGSTLAGSLDNFIEEDWNDLPAYGPADPLLLALQQLLSAGDAASLEAAVREGPALLDDSAQSLLGHVLRDSNETKPESAPRVQAAIDFVRRCRAEGIDAARAAAPALDHDRPGRRLDGETLELLSQLFDMGASLDTSAATDLAERVIERLEPLDDPVRWAIVHSKLGGLLRENTAGDRAASIERSLAAYDTALAAVTPNEPEVWALAVAGAAQSLQVRPSGDRTANFELAVKACESALELLDDNPGLAGARGALFDALGSALVDRPSGDRIDNIERAVGAFRTAVAIESEPIARAMYLNNLARAFTLRVRGHPPDNLSDAIDAYQESLGILAGQPYGGPDYPQAAMNLGVAYLNRDPGNQDDIESAIEWLDKAREAYTPEVAPRERARTVMNLATAYARRLAGGRDDNVARAARYLEDAIEAFDKWKQPLDLARARWNLATLISTDAAGTPLLDLRRAADLLEMVLEVYTPETNAVECRRAAARLADIRVQLGDPAAALEACETGVAAAETLYRRAYVPANQRVELAINAELYDLCISLCLSRETPELRRRGLLYAEAGRGRQFLDQMGLVSFPSPPDVEESVMVRETELLDALRSTETALAAQLVSPDEERRLAALRDEARGSLLRLWSELATGGRPAREYVAMRRGDSPGWKDLSALAASLGKTTALVSMYVLADEIVVFVLRAGWKSPRVHRCPVTRRELSEVYLRSFEEEVLGHQEFRRIGKEPAHEWLTLGNVLFEPLLKDLRDARLVYLVPHGMLHRLPLHALSVGGVPLIARVAVAYAPSAAILQRTIARRRAPEGRARALVAAYARADDKVRGELEQEAKAIAARFGATPQLGEAATATMIGREVPNADVVHLACHGFFDPDDPLGSGLELADGTFSARSWMSLRLEAGLVTLSACETGQLTASRGDEIVGLTRALLYSGATTAVVTLWRVYSDATLAWMVDFYSRVWGEDGKRRGDKAIAFQEATLALMSNDSDVVAWAPFVLVGDGH